MAQNRSQELLDEMDYRIAVLRASNSVINAMQELKPGEERMIQLESSSPDGGSPGIIRIVRDA